MIQPEDPYADFREFVQVEGQSLMRTAYVLTGDRHRAEDLVQSVLTKLAARWPRHKPPDDPGAYARAAVYREHASWRRVRRNHELPLADVSMVSKQVAGDFAEASATKVLLRKALASLPPRQRAVVVLRYYEDLSEAETAAVLDVRIGTVKAQAHKAMRKLRSVVPELSPLPTEATHEADPQGAVS